MHQARAAIDSACSQACGSGAGGLDLKTQSEHPRPGPRLRNSDEGLWGRPRSMLAKVAPRVVSFEEQVTAVREGLAEVHEREEDWTAAARTLAGIDLDSGVPPLPFRSAACSCLRPCCLSHLRLEQPMRPRQLMTALWLRVARHAAAGCGLPAGQEREDQHAVPGG